jgi:transposase
MNKMSVLPDFEGVGVHDRLKSYGQYNFTYSFYNACHLRELVFIAEKYEQNWAEKMNCLPKEMNKQVYIDMESGEERLNPEQLREMESEQKEKQSAGGNRNKAQLKIC